MSMTASCKKIVGCPAGQPHSRSPCIFSWPLKRVLQRWRECWRLADPSAPANARTNRPPLPPVSTTPVSATTGEYVPKPGMRGRDVQWVPCSPVVLDKMLDMAKVSPDDYVIDPGSGDGRIVIRVAKRGGRALGIEFNSKLVTRSRQNAEKEGVGDRAAFAVGNFFETDFSKATVITLFLRRDLNIKLRPKILGLKPGTRVVSNIFDMGDWEADEVVKVEDGDYYFQNHTVRRWIVPANVNGTWRLPEGELEVSQEFQMITGALGSEGQTVPIKGKMTGNRIDFAAGGRRYTGRVSEGRMVLETDDDSSTDWIATFDS